MIRILFFLTFFLPQITEAVVAYKESLYANTKELAILIEDGNDYQKKMLKEYAADWTKYGNLDFVYYDKMPKDGVHYIVTVNTEIPSPNGGKAHGVTIYPEQDPVKSANDRGPVLMIDPLRFYYNDPKLPKSEIATTDSSPFLARRVVLHEFGHLLGLEHEMQNKNFPIDFRETNNQFVAGQSHTASEEFYNHGEFDPYSIMGYQIKGLSPLPFLSLQDKLWIARTYPGRMTEDEIRKEHEKDIKKFSNNGYCKIYEPYSIDSKKFSCKEKFGIGLAKENWIHKIGCYDTIEKAISAMTKFSTALSNYCGPFYDEAPDNFEAENNTLNASPDCPPEGVSNLITDELTKDVAKILNQIPKPETH